MYFPVYFLICYDSSHIIYRLNNKLLHVWNIRVWDSDCFFSVNHKSKFMLPSFLQWCIRLAVSQSLVVNSVRFRLFFRQRFLNLWGRECFRSDLYVWATNMHTILNLSEDTLMLLEVECPSRSTSWTHHLT